MTSSFSIELYITLLHQEFVQHVMSQLQQNEVIENALRKDTKLVPEIIIGLNPIKVRNYQWNLTQCIKTN